MYKINKITLLISFLLIPFFFSNQMMEMFNLYLIYDLWRLIDIFVVIVLFFKYKYKPAKISLAITVLLLWLAFISYLNNTNFTASLMKVLTLIIFAFICDFFLQKSPSKLIDALMICFKIFIYLNFLSIILIPGGFKQGGHEKIWLLDNYAAQAKWFIPALCITFIKINCSKKNRKDKFFVFIIVLSVFLTKSASLMLAIVCMFLLLFFMEKIKVKLKAFHGIILELIFFFSIVCFRMQYLFSYLIQNTLGRDLTFTGRTAIWDSALAMFSQKPITGYGYWVYVPVKWIGSYTSVNGVAVAGHAHCQFLYFLIQGGMVFLIGFILVNYFTSKCLDKNYNNFSARFFIVSIITISIMGFVETTFDTPLPYLLFLVPFYLNKIDNDYIDRRQRKSYVRKVEYVNE